MNLTRRDLGRNLVTLAAATPLLSSENVALYAAEPVWIENELTRHYRRLVTPPLETFKQKKELHALTPSEWYALARHHQALWDEHSRLANLYHTDLVLQAMQARLHHKFDSHRLGKRAINDLLENGCHAILSRDRPRFRAIATYLENSHSSTFNPLLPPQCADLLSASSIMMGAMSLATAEAPFISVLLGVLSLTYSLIAVIQGHISVSLCG